MQRRIRARHALMVIVTSCVCLLMVGCGGGTGDGIGGSAVGRLLSVSFVGYPTAPSTGPSGGPLPAVFRDEVIEFTFDGPIDDEAFGGFLSDAQGSPLIFRGLAPNSAGESLYHAYHFQSAARNSLEIRANSPGGPFLSSYVVGRHKDKPDTLVIDPRVSGTNSFGLPSNPGFQENTEYTYRIPAANGITIRGTPAQGLGVAPTLLPIVTPNFSPEPGQSLLFLAGIAFSPDPVPPEVLSISTLSGAAGTSTDPIPATDGFEIVFSKLIANNSVDQLRNLRIVNNDILTQGNVGDPSQVPGSFTFDEVDNRTVIRFVPTPGFGPGLGSPPTLGYTIAVRVGSFQDPQVPPITGQAQGNPPVSLAISNSLQGLFVTQPTPGALGSATYIELFENQDQFDPSPDHDHAFPGFNVAAWAIPADDPCGDPVIPPPGGVGAPSSFLPELTTVRLMAARICGNPLATTGNGGSPLFLGTRTQFDLTQTVSSSLFPASLVGLVAPFDTAATAGATALNPNGGNHMIQLYENTDVGHNYPITAPVALQDSLELVEWGPVSDIVSGSCYPSYQAWFGMTTRCAPACAQTPCSNPGVIPTGPCTGLSQNYASNYDVATVQASDPQGLGGVLCSPIGAYVVSSQFARYMAFPINNPTFDFNPGDAPVGSNWHLLIEQNIEPASGTAAPPPSPPNPPACLANPNVNRFVAGANFPVRRAFGPPLSIQVAGVGNPMLISANFGGWDRYDWRFTWVKSRSHAQSKFYFQNSIDDPTYESVTIIPSPLDQPAGTSARWEFQGTDAVTLGGQPFGQFTPWLTYWDGVARDPNNPSAPTGQFFPEVLQQLDGFKYVRFRVSMRANHLQPLANGSFGTFQNYSGVIFNVSF